MGKSWNEMLGGIFQLTIAVDSVDPGIFTQKTTG